MSETGDIHRAMRRDRQQAKQRRRAEVAEEFEMLEPIAKRLRIQIKQFSEAHYQIIVDGRRVNFWPGTMRHDCEGLSSEPRSKWTLEELAVEVVKLIRWGG